MPLAFLFLLLAPLQVVAIEPNHLFEAGATWDHFLDRVDRQRELWLRTSSEATVSTEMVERVRRVGRDLQLLVVAEDWCPDSAYSVPYVARLAALAQVPMRVVDRATGEPAMRAHRTPDGRTATPTVVLFRPLNFRTCFDRSATVARMPGVSRREATGMKPIAESRC